MIVKKNVHISIIRRSLISLTARRKPAIIGENRNLELPAIDTRPFAFENSSLVRRSVTVAVNDGSIRAEKQELIATPR